MGNEFKDFEMETPSLTLEPDLGEFEKKEEVLPKKQTDVTTPLIVTNSDDYKDVKILSEDSVTPSDKVLEIVK